MSDIKRIAAQMRTAAAVTQNEFAAASLNVWADQLDALAVHGIMPPNLAHKLNAFAAEPEGTVNWSMIAWSLHRMLNAQPVTSPQPARITREACKWTLDNDPDYSWWESACGEAWTFTNGGPKENGMKFCPYCGGTLEVQE